MKLKDLLKENISLSLKQVDNEYIVNAVTNDNKKVGELRFVKSKFKPNLVASSVVVDPNYRRQGIGSSMYVYAEKQLKLKFTKSNDVLTPDGKELWNSPNRKFGK